MAWALNLTMPNPLGVTRIVPPSVMFQGNEDTRKAVVKAVATHQIQLTGGGLDEIDSSLQLPRRQLATLTVCLTFCGTLPLYLEY